ncbi:hypothetical protein GDO78_007822 [Eleutherodactylus coqui]|uniref:Selenoprotein P N-terminal domain-containing protein n=2 Tax=Eleutherodactylus coqui TaxID=57060 RepID=A0A8J6FIK3_ELECQ|nr:hypothetical protein GDO78_007822 [Eleutherodactylus coqui]KAG9488229.1 hypothetical protein GDO78_007822 [Eleutherodactylus coqui]
MNVSFVVVNHQGEDPRARYHGLKSRVSENIAVYQQEVDQADIWSLLSGDRNDFFIYDRCGRLVKHIGLPFSFLEFHYVEDAIKQIYCDSTCGECKHKIPDDVCKKEETPIQTKTDEKPIEAIKHHQEKEAAAEDSNRPNVRDHKKHHHHHHHHRAEGCQTPHERVEQRHEPDEKVGGVPERAIVPNTEVEGPALENKL